MSDSAGELVPVLLEIRNWLRVGFFTAARDALASHLNDDKKRLAYALADGERSIEAIRLATKMSPNKVHKLFSDCVRAGLMEVTPDKKRRALFDLDAFGLASEHDADSKE